MSAIDRLVGVRAKIERAKEHVLEAERIIKAFRESTPYGVVAEDDLDTGDKVQKLRFRLEVPAHLPSVIGDAVHNLRSSLDHLAWQLVDANGGDTTAKFYFPLHNTSAKYKAGANSRVNTFGPNLEGVLEAVQPYQIGYSDLGLLHELDIIDKHKMRLAPAFALTGITSPVLDMTKPGPHLIKFQFSAPSGFSPTQPAMLEDGAIIGRLLAGSSCEPNNNFNFSFDIAFGEPSIVKGKPVIPFLTQLAQFVDGLVNQFVPFL